MTALGQIEIASSRMLLRYPWWASLFLRLERIEDNNIPTAATDGTRLFYNSEFILSLTIPKLIGLLMHETGHCVLLHCYRRGSREPFRWNIACDETVNALLVADGLQLPDDGIPPCDIKFTAEERYPKIKTREIFIDVLDAKGRKGAMKESDWREAIVEARGTMPKGLKRICDLVSAPKIDWEDELAQFLHRSTIRADYHSWSRQSRRMSGAPGWKRSPERSIALCVDTSGSIDQPILSTFFAIIQDICSLTGVLLHVISCDSAVHQVIAPGEEIKHLQGGGGTDFRPAIEKAESLGVVGIVYLTDGQGEYGNEPGTDILWVMTSPSRPPFGRSISL